MQESKALTLTDERSPLFGCSGTAIALYPEINMRWSILNGYPPYWSWFHYRFEWLPTPQLLDEWIERGEIG